MTERRYSWLPSLDGRPVLGGNSDELRAAALGRHRPSGFQDLTGCGKNAAALCCGGIPNPAVRSITPFDTLVHYVPQLPRMSPAAASRSVFDTLDLRALDLAGFAGMINPSSKTATACRRVHSDTAGQEAVGDVRGQDDCWHR